MSNFLTTLNQKERNTTPTNMPTRLSPNLTIHRGLKKQIREPHNLRNLQKTTPILPYLKTTNVCPEEDTFANTNQPKTKSHKHHSMLGGGLVQLSVEGHSTEKRSPSAKRAQNRTDEHTAARSGMNMAALNSSPEHFKVTRQEPACICTPQLNPKLGSVSYQ